MLLILKGYHGTLEYKAINILKSGFKIKNSMWFGEGVYFYKDDKSMAEKWMKKKENYFKRKGRILSAEICVSEENVLDLTNGHSDDNKIFHDTRMLQIPDIIRIKNDDDEYMYDILTLKFLNKEMDYKVFIANTYSYQKRDKGKLNSRIPNGTEIIVKDTSLITNIK